MHTYTIEANNIIHVHFAHLWAAERECSNCQQHVFAMQICRMCIAIAQRNVCTYVWRVASATMRTFVHNEMRYRNIHIYLVQVLCDYIFGTVRSAVKSATVHAAPERKYCVRTVNYRFLEHNGKYWSHRAYFWSSSSDWRTYAKRNCTNSVLGFGYCITTAACLQKKTIRINDFANVQYYRIDVFRLYVYMHCSADKYGEMYTYRMQLTTCDIVPVIYTCDFHATMGYIYVFVSIVIRSQLAHEQCGSYVVLVCLFVCSRGGTLHISHTHAAYANAYQITRSYDSANSATNSQSSDWVAACKLRSLATNVRLALNLTFIGSAHAHTRVHMQHASDSIDSQWSPTPLARQ